MEQLLSVADLMDRYQCSRQTAICYMRKLEHMERPFMIRASVIEEWERDRTVKPAAVIRQEMMRERMQRRFG